MAMTLEKVRDWHLREAYATTEAQLLAEHQEMARAITDYLTQPAQAVDVGAIREVIETVKRIDPHWSQLPKLTRALAGEQADAVARGQSLGMVVYHDDEHAAAKLEGRRVLIVLDPSPTPDNAGEAHE